jgi:choline dehydrogenase
VRWNASFAYVDPARDRGNLTIAADTLADRLELEGNRVTGITVRDSSGERRISAGTVVLSAGTYMSPAILMRSGIGPADDLSRLDIPVRAALDGVGANLIDHPYAGARFRISAEPDDFDVTAWGPIIKARSNVSPDEFWDTHLLPYGLWLDENQESPALQFAIFAVESESRGRVTLQSSDPTTLPLLDQPWEHMADTDLTRLLEGIELARTLAATDALGPALGAEVEPGSVSDLSRHIRRSTGGYWHPVGTCRMGAAGDPHSVVDSRGRVNGVENLVVADASIFPVIPRANTNLPTMGAAEFIASTMLET